MQRVALARALILKPDFIIEDEPLSMLDASVRSGILLLLAELKHKFQLSQIFITHDLAMARCFCDEIAVMYLGKIVELGHSTRIVRKPMHPYTNALVSAVPVPNPTSKRAQKAIEGQITTSGKLPAGCRFHPRCAFAKEICRKLEPEPTILDKNHQVACHLVN